MKTIKQIGDETYLPLTPSELSILGVRAGQPVIVNVEAGRITITPKTDGYSRTLQTNRKTRQRYARTLEILRDA